MKICIIGTGYVGLVTGTCFAETGNTVTCVDVDLQKIQALQTGQIPIYEPGLAPLVATNVKRGRLHFTTDLTQGINNADICFIAVGTPANEDGSADLRHVLDVAEQIARVATRQVVIGTKSTVPVGTGDRIEALFKEKLKHDCIVFSNPEFLKEGDAVNDFMKPDRIVVGLNEDSVIPMMKALYEPFTRQRERLIIMSRRSAELTKYAANAMLASRISFMNEMANLCEKVGANINEVRKGIGSDPRIGPAFLFPGIGYGGSCFPKDVKAILRTAEEYQSPLEVIEATERANEVQKKALFKKITAYFGGAHQLTGLRFAIWGLAFKANTDDIRESAALVLIKDLLDAGAQITAFDPEAMDNMKHVLGNTINYSGNEYDCLNEASALLIATDWNEFRSPDFRRIKQTLKRPVIFDGRNILNRDHALKEGFTYFGVGV